MRKTVIGFTLSTLLLALCVPAQAQQVAKIPRMGFLTSGAGAALKPLQQRLEELGYVKGKNILIEYRSAEGKLDRLPDLAAELVRLKVDLIVAAATPAAHAAKHATTTIPIVMVDVGDPVATGLVASLARPGGNITGLATLSPELSGKRFELLKEVVPTASRVAIFSNPTSSHQPAPIEGSSGCSAGLGCSDTSLGGVKVRGLRRGICCNGARAY